MIKLLLLAVVPFMTEHRNVTPKTEVSTNFYGSVTGIVDNAYIQAHGGGGGGGVDTNAVRDIAREEIVQATNSLNQTLSDAISGKLDASPDLELYPHTKIYWYEEYLNIDGYVNMNRGLSIAAPVYANAYESDVWDSYVANGETLPTYLASGNWNTAPDPFVKRSDISASNPTFSNAVLTVGLNIDTNSVAVLNEIASTFGGFPIEGTATTVGGLLAALAAAIAWLKKNKVRTLKLEDGSVVKTAENGVAKLDDFFKESNTLLNSRITYERNATGLKDRAFNALTFDGTEYNLSTALAAVTPTASGQPRDLLIVATATAATTISFTAGTIKGDKPTIDGSGTWLITLTEYASGVWYCRQIKMEDAA